MPGFLFQRQKKSALARRCRPSQSGALNIGRLLALGALNHFEADLLALFQGLEALHRDSREMSEQIFAAIIGSDKTETLGIIEPLDGTRCHKTSFIKRDIYPAPQHMNGMRRIAGDMFVLQVLDSGESQSGKSET